MTGLLAALAGADSLIACGGLDSVQMESLAKVVLDCDSAGRHQRYVTREPHRRDARAHGRHRRGRHRRSLSRAATARAPTRAARSGGRRSSSAARSRSIKDRTLVADAVQRAHELLATHEVEPLPDDADRHIDAVIGAHVARRR